jgi:hypothetical protein
MRTGTEDLPHCEAATTLPVQVADSRSPLNAVPNPHKEIHMINNTAFAQHYRTAALALTEAVASSSPTGFLADAQQSAEGALRSAGNIIEEKLASDLLESIRTIRPLVLA